MAALTVDVIAGARPNFMKVAALFALTAEFPDLDLRLIHTGQHYDAQMSDVFFTELGLPQPVRNLGVGSASHAVQTAEIMTAYEQWVREHRPDLCLVVGDVNSTVACALVAAKEGIRLGHIEAGLRSFDRTMPEEINRMATDAISDLFFVTEPSGVANLAREGHDPDRIHLVGHVMIDTLLRMKPKAAALQTSDRFGVASGEYAYLTLHRPSNVDDPQILGEICDQLLWLADRIPVVFAIHPRTRQRLETSGLMRRLDDCTGIHASEPVGYLESLSLMLGAQLVVTDSGGLQEETSAVGVPCLTLRDNTERPITVTEGTNTLIGRDWNLLRRCVDSVTAGTYAKAGAAIPYWDGNAGRRILGICSRA